MLLPSLRKQVLDANLELVRQGLVVHTFGNASGIAREQGLVVIKPSGVPYEEMKPEDLVISDLQGKTVEGQLRPSSDLPTHIVLYQAFPRIGAVAHTHSEYATAWAQARRCLPCLGTTHADYFHGAVPVTEALNSEDIASHYEENTGHCIVRAFKQVDYEAIPAVLVAGHGPFTWGRDAASAAHNAVMLEAVARMAYLTLSINHAAEPIGQDLHDKHYLRKHGSKAYYGQRRDCT
jgi:L-ribulose-5-phosphate 4-epimerase